MEKHHSSSGTFSDIKNTHLSHKENINILNREPKWIEGSERSAVTQMTLWDYKVKIACLLITGIH